MMASFLPTRAAEAKPGDRKLYTSILANSKRKDPGRKIRVVVR
jgi:hypothetical protein